MLEITDMQEIATTNKCNKIGENLKPDNPALFICFI